MRKEKVRERGEGEKEICSCVEQLHKGDEVLTSELKYDQLKQTYSKTRVNAKKLENRLSVLFKNISIVIGQQNYFRDPRASAPLA